MITDKLFQQKEHYGYDQIWSILILREGLNKNINKIGGIFHGGLTPYMENY